MVDLIYLVAVLITGFLWFLSLYNVPIFLAGVKRMVFERRKSKMPVLDKKSLPKVSLIVPAKNEDKVIGRLLDALLKADYPSNKKEIIVVEDGSADNTFSICEQFVNNYPRQVKLVRREFSDGKPGALREAFKYVSGDIVGVFDADNIPDTDSVFRAVSYFEDDEVAAVQGCLKGVNEDENIITKFISREEALIGDTIMRGKDSLGLFVPLNGSCYFVRKLVLDELDNWNGNVLSEDFELAARLVDNGHKIRYGFDIRSLQEHPSTVSSFVNQRTRWYRGAIEVSLKYGRLLRHPSLRTVDAEFTFATPFVLVSSLFSYFFAIYSFTSNSGGLQDFFAVSAPLVSFLMFGLAAVALIFAEKRRKVSNIFWVPFIYFYWFLQLFVAFRALLMHLFRRPKRWIKTVKTGRTTLDISV